MSLIDGTGLWVAARVGPAAQSRAAVFLDRDGVIIEDTGYPGSAADIRLIPGAAEAIARINAMGHPVVVITNQSGIARGFYGWDDFGAVQLAIDASLTRAGAHVDLVLACGFHDVGAEPLAVADHPWRKPNPGMLLEAADRLGLELSQCLVVGDKISDLVAGHRAGLAAGFLVRTGHSAPDEASLARLPNEFAYVADSFSAATTFILQHLKELQPQS